ncbi:MULTISPECIES: hypothetical protein [Pseudomonas]|jgi:hypothetical protein|uniref:AtuA-related protein n=1 Tax=Pseudomonas TaxID=286 RepID=UPI0008775011|nr:MULTISPECIES: hypothetical protein [Pseudomonas]MDB6442718.1 hypothetical protein [Pseudomonas sp. 21TX0197]MDT8905482.1 hypothetical protein [Pseudomonas prosekii]SCX66746.1 hypothetical protein SAMN03159507_03338 [Pseudomonas sp. NFACC32-1]SFW46352.1 hypothetical protein SAMN03159376_01683 [Pseudomonas sp. NFACC09-4]SFX53482.1 hypothetical protein SAMN03159442_01978 [Pseudomonas sp. NFACC47-1]
MNTVLLADYAHARAGDKGNILSVAVFPHDPAHYPWLVRELSAARVAAQFATRRPSRVHRYELPNLKALNFVLEDALEGGVNLSCGLDRHGKSLSYLLLALCLPEPPG